MSDDESKIGIDDDELPPDLVPDDDNPLAQGLPAGESVEGLLTEGKHAEQDESQEESQDGSGQDESGTSHEE